MRLGVEATDATHILFVDADCTDLTSAHLDAICEPVAATLAPTVATSSRAGITTYTVVMARH